MMNYWLIIITANFHQTMIYMKMMEVIKMLLRIINIR